jgi:hypothetical protein
MTYHSFLYDTPRAEACCRFGYRFMEKNELQKAIFCYDLAIKTPEPTSWGMMEPSCRTWLPHNEKARSYNPHHGGILYNKAYLKGKISKPQA